MFNAILPVITAPIAAADGVDGYLLWSARSLGASQRHLLREIILPVIGCDARCAMRLGAQ